MRGRNRRGGVAGGGGQWQAVTGLTFSEALDPYVYYQTIAMTFDPIAGSAVRIRGTAGGSQEYTSIVELDAYGAMGIAGDCNEDGIVDAADYIALKIHMGLGSAATWADGDFDFDGDVDFNDLQLLMSSFGQTSADSAVYTPEPASVLFLAGGAAWFAWRRRGPKRRPNASLTGPAVRGRIPRISTVTLRVRPPGPACRRA